MRDMQNPDVSISRMVTLMASGQVSGAPMGEVLQSQARICCAISLVPIKIALVGYDALETVKSALRPAVYGGVHAQHSRDGHTTASEQVIFTG
jgi:hypothetical protein